MNKKVDFESLSKGGFITLENKEYESLKKDILAVIKQTINSGREMNKTMNSSLLVVNLMIGLSFIYAKKIQTSIIQIGYAKSGILQFALYDTDYLVLEEEIRKLV